ncbi:MBL fold metallo-hydrolase [Candidatus Pelagibacter bacterium]|jgi:sulfur dioxygenase|nr:MBL fold metallo-hydrolase [Candidatus Pelagibacter sp.]MDB2591270.1 MBL fold metallo-hydrolase [Candidatus Pelagibacter bacterium]MDB2655441.1 MBL fold metallo-hydrolase [Candidatus Pelagibacter bacterium]
MIFRQIFDSNSFTYTYLISSGIGREALIIDPVLEKVDQYIKLLKELDLKLVKVIDTHIHADHISGIAELRDKTNCVTVMGDKTPADVVAMKVSDEETVKIEGIDLKALYTPGHTSESFSFLMKDRIFTGDTLLIKGTGRTDFQNGNPKDSYNSLFGKLLKLPDDTLVYPAHDYKGETVSTILEEKKFNPRLQVNSVDEYVDIMNNLNLPNPKMMDVAVPSNLNLGIDFNRQKVNNGIEPEQFNEIKNDPDAILIDLREQIEIDKEGMIKNSKIVPFPSMYEYLDKNKDKLKDKRILFYCAHGHRSTLAVQISKSYNFTNCCHLIGGLKNWKKEGLDLI